MALTEDKILVSFEINVQSATVHVLWSDRILRDGEVIQSTNTRGAYELVEGELPQYIQDQLDLSIAEFASQSVVELTKSNSSLRADKSLKENEIVQLKEEIEVLKGQIPKAEEVINVEALNSKATKSKP